MSDPRRKIVLMNMILSCLKELAILNNRSVLAEVEDLRDSMVQVLDEVPLEERDPSVLWREEPVDV